MEITPQVKQWDGKFGQEYTERNPSSPSEMDALYQKQYGITRTALNSRFLADVPKNTRILEVGCNVGTQLLLLHEMGYNDLNGVDVQEYALEKVRNRLPNGQFKQASALDIPFPDEYFGLVFTSVMLIHLAPENLAKALSEIHRCSAKHIWGIEYYAPDITMVEYRGHRNMLWKADYARLYLEAFRDLELIKTERIFYEDNSNEDRMFLLRKKP